MAWKVRSLDIVEFVEAFSLGHTSGAIKSLPAFAATVRTIGQEEQDPKFQNTSALGAMDVFAAAQRAIPFFGVHKQTKFAFHWEGIITLGHGGGNSPGSVMLP